MKNKGKKTLHAKPSLMVRKTWNGQMNLSVFYTCLMFIIGISLKSQQLLSREKWVLFLSLAHIKIIPHGKKFLFWKVR